MPNVQFDNSGIEVRQAFPASNQPKRGLTGWLIRSGVAKDSTRAGFIYIGVILMFVVYASYVYFSGSSNLNSIKDDNQRLKKINQAQFAQPK
ncbi:MAG: hypothetical protein V4465_02315 [Patescibacteria group bacterium]